MRSPRRNSPSRPASSGDATRFLDPAVVGRLRNIELRARLVVEGYIAGLHRSPYHGFSVEFAEYRQYMQGDSLRHIDWKVYARTERAYVKLFEEETNLISYLLVDASGSMAFPTHDEVVARRRADGRRGRVGQNAYVDKFSYASMLAASLAWLMIRQHDAVGLALFDERIRTLVPHRSVRRHLFHLLGTLENATPSRETGTAPVLHEMAERMRRRGLAVIVSDLMDDPEAVLMGLKHFRHRGHEVIVFHVLDPREIDLGYRDEVEFEDLETGRRLRVEPGFLRERYRGDVGAWLRTLERGCRSHDIDYNLLRTDTPFDVALTAYLGKRLRAG